jgi:Methyltransferase domain
MRRELMAAGHPEDVADGAVWWSFTTDKINRTPRKEIIACITGSKFRIQALKEDGGEIPTAAMLIRLRHGDWWDPEEDYSIRQFMFLLRKDMSTSLVALGLVPPTEADRDEMPGRLKWNPQLANTYEGPSLAIQTTYEQRYLRSAIRQVTSRLPQRAKAADFGAGYSRLTPVLEEFFTTAIGLEREPDLIALSKRPVTTIDMCPVQKLSEVPLETGEVALAFTCAVLQHMMDEDVAATLTEMRRVARGGFVILIELTREGYQDGTYGGATYFTKGRSLATFQRLMEPWVLDFSRPRPIGSVNGPVWGEVMVFRDPQIPSSGVRPSGAWEQAELRPELASKG